MSLAIDSDFGADGVTLVLQVPIGVLRSGEQVRSGGIDEAHVNLLMETADKWPPIVIWGDACLVVDGSHRVEAARRLGHRTIAAVRFVGSREDAFLESVRSNVDHGLPLSIADRRRAALRILSSHGDWSDRRIASMCGLSGKTVGRLREEELTPTDPDNSVVVELERRVGRDGKVRPIQAGAVRERIMRALEENPDSSLRRIAAIAGASPETVRTVRARLSEDGETAPVSAPNGTRRSRPCTADIQTITPDLMHLGFNSGPRPAQYGKNWTSDAALLSCGDGGDFAHWFADSRIDDDWHKYVWTVPLGRIYDVVDEARRRGSAWNSFASLLEVRTR